MRTVSKYTLAMVLILVSMHTAQAWTGNDVKNAGAIVVLGQRLPCRDEPARKSAKKRTCSRTVRGSELPGRVKNRRWPEPGDFTCESEVYRDSRGKPLVTLTCTKFLYGCDQHVRSHRTETHDAFDRRTIRVCDHSLPEQRQRLETGLDFQLFG